MNFLINKEIPNIEKDSIKKFLKNKTKEEIIKNIDSFLRNRKIYLEIKEDSKDIYEFKRRIF
jgi:hypothetical protein